MADINATYEEIHSAATRLTTGQDELTSKLTELKSFIANLISSGFVTDQASVAFGQTYEQFTTSATTTISSLASLSQYLNTAATTLQDTDAALAAGLR
jgi:WXG100 family type VII secretion target